MKLRNLLFLYVQRVRTHPLQELLALLGIAVGVALVFAVLVANTSVAGSVRQLMEGVTGSAELQVAARSEAGFDVRLADEIARIPGVRAAAPVVIARVEMRGPDGSHTTSLLGGDRRLLAIGGDLPGQFASPSLDRLQAIALPAPLTRQLGLSVGDRVRVTSGAQMHTAPLASVLSREEIGALVDSPIALAPLAFAQRLGAMPGRATRVLVAARPGRVDEVRAALTRLVGGRLNVTDGTLDARILAQATAPNDQSTALFAAISALVGLLFAFNAMLLTVPERRRFIADLRMEGLGDLTVVQLVLFDALVLGAAATAIGLLLGDQLSQHIFHAVPGYLSFAFPVGDQRIVETRTVLIAVAGGMAATLLAALRPLSDLFSRRPLDDILREDDGHAEDTLPAQGWALLGGALLVAAAVGVLVLAPHTTIAGIVLLLGGMLLLIPGLLAGGVRLIDALSQRTRSAVLVVSVGELRSTTTRSIALAATGALAVFGSVAVEGSHFDLQRGLDRDAHQFNAQADLWITPSGTQNELATIGFAPTPGLLDAVAATPGVGVVRATRGTFLDVGDRRVWVVGPARENPAPLLPSQIVDGDLAQATQRLRGDGWVALSNALAAQLHVSIGEVVTLPTPQPLRLRVAATLTNLGWSSGAVVLNAADFRRAWGSDDISALQVLLRPGTSLDTAAAGLRRALGPHAGLTVESAASRELRFRASTRQGLGRLTQIATLVLVAAALALAAAMGGVIWNRRPRLAALKLSGFGDGAVWRAIVLESSIVLGIGCSIGALFGLCGQFMLTRWLAETTDFPTSYAPAGWLALATFAGVTLVAVAIAAAPGYAAARVPATASITQD